MTDLQNGLPERTLRDFECGIGRYRVCIADTLPEGCQASAVCGYVQRYRELLNGACNGSDDKTVATKEIDMQSLRDKVVEWLIVLGIIIMLVAFALVSIGIPRAVILWLLSKQGC